MYEHFCFGTFHKNFKSPNWAVIQNGATGNILYEKEKNMKLYVLDTANKMETAVIEEKLHLMPRSRILQAEKIMLQKNKVMNVAAFLLLAYGLKEHGIAMKDIALSYGENGKPYLIGNAVYFNISHSHERAVCCISEYECGVDIEKIRPVSMKLIDRVCSEEEKEAILTAENREEAFARLWTKKEAYIKLKGSGILTDLKKIGEKIEQENIYLYSMKLQDYALCACSAKDRTAEKITVTMRRLQSLK